MLGLGSAEHLSRAEPSARLGRAEPARPSQSVKLGLGLGSAEPEKCLLGSSLVGI